MMLIRIPITILLIAIFKTTVEGVTLPLFYNVENDWNGGDESLEHNNSPQGGYTLLGNWNNIDRRGLNRHTALVSLNIYS